MGLPTASLNTLNGPLCSVHSWHPDVSPILRVCRVYFVFPAESLQLKTGRLSLSVISPRCSSCSRRIPASFWSRRAAWLGLAVVCSVGLLSWRLLSPSSGTARYLRAGTAEGTARLWGDDTCANVSDGIGPDKVQRGISAGRDIYRINVNKTGSIYGAKHLLKLKRKRQTNDNIRPLVDIYSLSSCHRSFNSVSCEFEVAYS